MSSCVIKRNSKGKITRVLTPSGEVSTLFDKIAGIATVSDLNKAAEAYMTIYNDKFRSKFGDWTRSVPRNKEAARSISARLSASEWGQLMSAKVLTWMPQRWPEALGIATMSWLILPPER